MCVCVFVCCFWWSYYVTINLCIDFCNLITWEDWSAYAQLNALGVISSVYLQVLWAFVCEREGGELQLKRGSMEINNNVSYKQNYEKVVQCAFEHRKLCMLVCMCVCAWCV